MTRKARLFRWATDSSSKEKLGPYDWHPTDSIGSTLNNGPRFSCLGRGRKHKIVHWETVKARDPSSGWSIESHATTVALSLINNTQIGHEIRMILIFFYAQSGRVTVACVASHLFRRWFMWNGWSIRCLNGIYSLLPYLEHSIFSGSFHETAN